MQRLLVAERGAENETEKLKLEKEMVNDSGWRNESSTKHGTPSASKQETRRLVATATYLRSAGEKLRFGAGA